ncbi:MAG TPA: hypothetical protein VGE93_24045, partial [Bryobacteraceae bacterium]
MGVFRNENAAAFPLPGYPETGKMLRMKCLKRRKNDMRLRVGLAVALWCGLAGVASAQSTSLQPLQAMPYSPSLNVADMDKSVDP